jgi:hypothetical protein
VYEKRARTFGIRALEPLNIMQQKRFAPAKGFEDEVQFKIEGWLGKFG